MSDFLNEILTIPRFIAYQIGLDPIAWVLFLLVFIGINVGFYFIIRKIFKEKKVKILAMIIGFVLSIGILYLLAVTVAPAIRYIKYDDPTSVTGERVYIRYSIFVSKPDSFLVNTRIIYREPGNETKYFATIKKDLDNGQYEIFSGGETKTIHHDWIIAKD